MFPLTFPCILSHNGSPPYKTRGANHRRKKGRGKEAQILKKLKVCELSTVGVNHPVKKEMQKGSKYTRSFDQLNDLLNQHLKLSPDQDQDVNDFLSALLLSDDLVLDTEGKILNKIAYLARSKEKGEVLPLPYDSRMRLYDHFMSTGNGPHSEGLKQTIRSYLEKEDRETLSLLRLHSEYTSKPMQSMIRRCCFP